MIRQLFLFCVIAVGVLPAHEIRPPRDIIIFPPRRIIHPRPVQQPVQITQVAARIEIDGLVARTQIDIGLHNPNNRPMEAELVMPVPDGCVVTGLDFEGKASEPQARLIDKEEARRIYESIVAKMRDPALMEFIGMNMVRSSVFPVEANKKQTLRLSYEQLLPRSGTRMDYVLPRSGQLTGTIPWSIEAVIRSEQKLASVYSPSHRLETEQIAAGHMKIRLAKGAERTAGSFHLHIMSTQEDVAMSVVSFPDTKKGGGYFMLLAGAPKPERQNETLPRELTIVIDRSGSMNKDGKLDQVRDAALQVIAGLDEGELFNVIIYNHGVERFAKEPVVKNTANVKSVTAWLTAMNPRGGTNIFDALHEALQQPKRSETLAMTLFLTDGVPTVGNTGERAIRDMAMGRNPHKRRIFTIGVGLEVNTHLLEKLSDDSRASSMFIMPEEDIEVPVATMSERLQGPVWSDLACAVVDKHGQELSGKIIDVMPTAAGDLFVGEEVLILGRYISEEQLRFRLSGNTKAGERALSIDFDPKQSSLSNGHVPRLWAHRKIGILVDAIREMGADSSTAVRSSPKYQELVKEIVDLSTEFGVLTEYTAFLSEQGSIPSRPDSLAMAERELNRRAIGQRAGAGAFSQSFNGVSRKYTKQLNPGNVFKDEAMEDQDAVGSIQPFNNRAYYCKGQRWIDSSIMAQGKKDSDIKIDKTIAFASKEYFELANQLTRLNQQGSLAMDGELLLQVDDLTILIQAP